MNSRSIAGLAVRIVLVAVVIMLILLGTVSAQESADEAVHSPVTIPLSEVRALTSEVMGHDYWVSVALPLSYNETEKTYPVLYVLDPQTSMGIVTDVVRVGAWGGGIPEVIVVGIGQAVEIDGGASIREILSLRSREMGANPDRFLRFVKQELIPFVDSTYRTDPTDRAIAGHSLSGGFVLYALYNSSETFHRYVAGSTNTYLPPNITTFVEQWPGLPVRLFVSVGEREGGSESSLNAFSKAFDDANLETFDITTLVIEGATHYSSHPIHLTRGIYAVYGP